MRSIPNRLVTHQSVTTGVIGTPPTVWGWRPMAPFFVGQWDAAAGNGMWQWHKYARATEPIRPEKSHKNVSDPPMCAVCLPRYHRPILLNRKHGSVHVQYLAQPLDYLLQPLVTSLTRLYEPKGK